MKTAKELQMELDGKAVSLYTLFNKKGMSADITNYGAKVIRLMVPDKNGIFDDVVLAFDTLEEVVEKAYIMNPELDTQNRKAIMKQMTPVIIKKLFSLGINSSYTIHNIFNRIYKFHKSTWNNWCYCWWNRWNINCSYVLESKKKTI